MTTHVLVAKVSRVLLCLVFLTAAGASVADDLELVRLNACNDMLEGLRSLKRTTTDCVAATGVIQRTLRDAFAGGGATMCVLAHPPVSSLSGFKCIQWSGMGDSRTTACYRPADVELLSDYTANYVAKYSARAATYLNEAKRCPGSNGDASRIQETTFPPMLMPIAANDFGFQVQFGNTKPSTSVVSHGFARTSPEVARRGPEAIEYVMFADGLTSTLEARTPVGNWQIRVDEAGKAFAPYLERLAQQGVDNYPAFVDIDMLRAPRASVRTKVPSLPDELVNIVVAKLEDEGFTEMSDEDMRRKTGRTLNEMLEAFSKGVSFGARKAVGSRKPTVRMMVKTSGIACARSGNGAIGAYLFAMDGEDGVQADFGSVSTMVLGLGTCASSVQAGRQYVRNLATESKQTLLDSLASR